MASKREIDGMPEQVLEKIFLLPNLKENSKDNSEKDNSSEIIKTGKDGDIGLLGWSKSKKVVEDTRDEVEEIQGTGKDGSADHKEILEL